MPAPRRADTSGPALASSQNQQGDGGDGARASSYPVTVCIYNASVIDQTALEGHARSMRVSQDLKDIAQKGA
eukprot:15332714-Alexandrium_andersonii.AAC.1